MELKLTRVQKTEKYTLGVISIEGRSETFPTVEDKVREDGVKVQNETAIPAGRYKITLDVVSPKFSQYPFYMEVCEGKLPRLLDVPGFSGILTHCGRNEAQSSGCIILNDYNAALERSKEYFKQFYAILKSATDDIYITIE